LKHLLQRKNVLTSLLLICVTFSLAHAQNKKPIKGPTIKGYGPVFAVKDRAKKLPQNFQYKVVFDVLSSAKDPQQLNRRLESIARFINMLTINQVPLKNIHIAAVFHGKATSNLLKNSVYHARFNTDNPNINLLHQLNQNGVEFYVCGQSVAFPGFKKSDLIYPQSLALSAMTTFVILQQQGYQLLPD